MRVFLVIYLFSTFLFGFAQDIKNPKSFNGAVTEHIINDYMRSNGARMINAEVGSNGIDGLFYKKVNGKVKVFVIESKFNTSNLGNTKTYGKQMSKEWKIGKIEEKISQLKNNLNSNFSPSEIKKIKKEIKLLNEAKEVIKYGKDTSLLFNIKPLEEGKYQLKLYEVDNFGKIVGEAKRFGLNNKVIDLNKRYKKGTIEYKAQKLISHSIRKEKRIRLEKEKLNVLKEELKTIPKNSPKYELKLSKIEKQTQKISKIDRSLPKLAKAIRYSSPAVIGAIEVGSTALGASILAKSGIVASSFLKSLPFIGIVAQMAYDMYVMSRIDENSKMIYVNRNMIKINTQYIQRLTQEQKILKQNIANNTYKINQIIDNLLIMNKQINYLKSDIANITYKIDDLTTLVQQNSKEIKEIKHGIFITGVKELKTYYDTQDSKYLANALNDFEITKNIKNNKVKALVDYYLIIAHYENFLLTKKSKEIEIIDALFTDLKIQTIDNYKNISLLINAYNAVSDNEYMKNTYKNITYKVTKEVVNNLIKNRNFDKAVDIAQNLGNSNLIQYTKEKRKQNYLKYKDFGTIQNVNYIINKYQNTLLNKEAVKFLYKNDTYLEALQILRNKRIEDEYFVLKAYLLIYKQLGYTKELKALVNLIIENDTYSKNIKDYVENKFL